jgi:phage regulator Rha-like protein
MRNEGGSRRAIRTLPVSSTKERHPLRTQKIQIEGNKINALVSIHEGSPVVSHRVVAENISYNQNNLSRVIREHIEDFEEFGAVGFEIQARKDGNRGGDQAKTYLLNEPQATLLMTYLKNTPIVRQFKKTLVRAFYEMRAVVSPHALDAVLAAKVDELAMQVEALKVNRMVVFKRPQGSRLSADEIERITTLKAKGYSTGMIAKDIGCGETTVRDVIARAQVKPKPKAQGFIKTLFGGL